MSKTRSPRAPGGIRLRSGVKAKAEKPVSMAEHRQIRHSHSSRRNLKTFSELDTFVADVEGLTSVDTCDKFVDVICELRERGYRKIKPQLSQILVLVSRLARHDGYSLRAVADAAFKALRP